jgi:hypothetical protein
MGSGVFGTMPNAVPAPAQIVNLNFVDPKTGNLTPAMPTYLSPTDAAFYAGSLMQNDFYYGGPGSP